MISNDYSKLINIQNQHATGWLGSLSLSFENRHDRTELIERQQQGPLTIQRPFYPEGKPCHIYLLHPPGGVVGGDQLDLNVHLASNSHLLMTMPGATKFYRSVSDTAFIQQRFSLSPNSTMEWLPQENIFFNGANASIKTEFHLTTGCQLLGWETLCFGRPVMKDRFEQGNVQNQLSIYLPDAVGLDEHLRIIDGNCGPLGDYTYNTTLFAYPIHEGILQQIQQFLKNSQIPVGVTALEQLLVVRLLAHDNQICQQYLYKLWSVLRPLIIQLPPCPPRIWAT